MYVCVSAARTCLCNYPPPSLLRVKRSFETARLILSHLGLLGIEGIKVRNHLRVRVGVRVSVGLGLGLGLVLVLGG